MNAYARTHAEFVALHTLVQYMGYHRRKGVHAEKHVLSLSHISTTSVHQIYVCIHIFVHVYIHAMYSSA